MRTALDLAPLFRARLSRGAASPGPIARPSFERRQAQAARSLLSPPFTFSLCRDAQSRMDFLRALGATTRRQYGDITPWLISSTSLSGFCSSS